MTRRVRDFYDRYGWKKNGDDYGDAKAFLDRRHCVKQYLERAEERARDAFASTEGRFFLDAGCGANPRTDLSANYRRHVCVDFSIRGLKEARSKAGNRGLFVLADMTRLPFREDTFDGAVSAHSIYHVPGRENQGKAFEELYRTLQAGGRALVLYINPNHRRYFDLSLGTLLIRNALGDLKGALRRYVTGKEAGSVSDEDGFYDSAGGVEADWYFRAFPIPWVKSNFPDGMVEVKCFRVWTHGFTKRFVSDNAFWRGVLRVTSALERVMGRPLAHFGHYVMVSVRK